MSAPLFARWRSTHALLILLVGLVAGLVPAASHAAQPLTLDDISAGRMKTCAIKSADGSPVCWGSENATDLHVPAGLTGLQAISAGAAHACAIKADDALVCWGGYGQPTDVPPAGLGTVKAVDTGSASTCVIKADDTAACWGDTVPSIDVPSGLGTVEDISLGESFACAVKTDGTPVCFGAAPALPAGLGKVQQVAVGPEHACAVKVDGTAACWGVGTESKRTVPAGLGTVTQVAVSFGTSCAIKADHTVACWGGGADALPAGLGTVSRLDGGYAHFCALKSDVAGDWACWGSNGSGQLGGAPHVTGDTPPAVAPVGPYLHHFSSDTGQVTFAVTAGALPPGLTLDADTGTLSGTVSTPGTYTATVAATSSLFGTGPGVTFTIATDFDAPAAPKPLAGQTTFTAGGEVLVKGTAEAGSIVWLHRTADCSDVASLVPAEKLASEGYRVLTSASTTVITGVAHDAAGNVSACGVILTLAPPATPAPGPAATPAPGPIVTPAPVCTPVPFGLLSARRSGKRGAVVSGFATPGGSVTVKAQGAGSERVKAGKDGLFEASLSFRKSSALEDARFTATATGSPKASVRLVPGLKLSGRKGSVVVRADFDEKRALTASVSAERDCKVVPFATPGVSAKGRLAVTLPPAATRVIYRFTVRSSKGTVATFGVAVPAS